MTLARAAGAGVSIDLASAGPLLARGRDDAQARIAAVDPDVLLSNGVEAAAFLGDAGIEELLRFAPVVVVKRGVSGATVLARRAGADPLRIDVATRAMPAEDSTGAGDAFDAGFLAAWLASGRRLTPTVLARAGRAGNRLAARQIGAPRPEISLG